MCSLTSETDDLVMARLIIPGVSALAKVDESSLFICGILKDKMTRR